MRQAVCCAGLIILLAAVLVLGLLACERGLHEVSGLPGYPGVLALTRQEGEPWVFIFAGRRLELDPVLFLHFLR